MCMCYYVGQHVARLLLVMMIWMQFGFWFNNKLLLMVTAIIAGYFITRL